MPDAFEQMQAQLEQTHDEPTPTLYSGFWLNLCMRARPRNVDFVFNLFDSKLILETLIVSLQYLVFEEVSWEPPLSFVHCANSTILE